jgi:Domain of unknown function (DUF4386)
MMSRIEQKPADRTVYLFAAFFLVVHTIVMLSGFSALSGVFQLPDVLRLPALERLALFRDELEVIVPAYWTLAVSGFIQIFVAVFLALALRPYAGVLVTLILVFGTIAGLFQVLGFGRWAVLMPYLAEQIANPNFNSGAREIIGLIEGSFNGYTGLLVGEHMTYIATGLWFFFVGLGIRRSGVLDARLGLLAIVASLPMFLLAAEQLGYASGASAFIIGFGLPLIAIIHLGLAWQLVRRKGLAKAPVLGVGFVVVAVVAYGVMVVPRFVS